MNTVLVVTGSQVLVEDGSVATFKCVLLAVSVTEMISLASCLWISIMSVLVRNTATIKLTVALGNSNRYRLYRLHLIRSLLKEHWAYRLLICRLRGMVIGFMGRGIWVSMVFRLVGRGIWVSVVFRLMRRGIRIRTMVGRSVRWNIRLRSIRLRSVRSRCIRLRSVRSRSIRLRSILFRSIRLRSKRFRNMRLRSRTIVRLQLQRRGVT